MSKVVTMEGTEHLSNHEWAKLVQDKVQDINLLLAQADERDVFVDIKAMKNPIHEFTIVGIRLSERL